MPTIFDRTYGVEIEAIMPRGMTESALTAALVAGGVNVYHTTYGDRRPVPRWKVKPDGSLSNNGAEVVSPPLSGEEGFEEIRKVCAVLNEKGLTVNRSCGLHVHCDIREFRNDPKPLARLAIDYARHEKVLDMVMPKSRRANNNSRYLATIARRNRQDMATATSIDRLVSVVGNKYVKLNFAAYWNHGTVEFRHHSGTIDATKIEMWVRLCLRMINKAKYASNGVMVQPPAGSPAARVNPPRVGTKQAIIYAMMTRPEGCTRGEILAATGWPAISLQQQAGWLGLNLTKRRAYSGRSRWRYYATPILAGQEMPTTRVATDVVTVPTTRVTFDSFINSLSDMPTLEVNYWTARKAHFAVADDDESPAAAATPPDVSVGTASPITPWFARNPNPGDV